MPNLQGTRTANNLMASFAGESQADMRYTYYASVARKEGYVQIADIFLETARNEQEHAKRFFKFLNADLSGEVVNVNWDYPVTYQDTLTNLKAAAAGEHEEYADMYPEFADIADEEGFTEIAHIFREIAEVEERHEARFLKLAANMEEGIVFERPDIMEWKCDNCGYIHTGKSAPEVCPACAHAQKYFQLFIPNY